MIDATLVKNILRSIGEGQYIGTPTTKLINELVGDLEEADANTIEKFIYHMDELFEAGLFRAKNLGHEHGWGANVYVDGDVDFEKTMLVLSPIGGEILEELSKPKGLERLKSSIRNVGAVAGTEAVKYAIGELLKG